MRRCRTGRGASSASSTALIGHVKDATRDYLHGFEGWTLQAAERVHTRKRGHGARCDLRRREGRAARRWPAQCRPAPSPSCAPGLAAPRFAALAEEWELLRQHDAAWSVAPYPVVLVTVDCVVNARDHVLLIRRGHSPGKGLFAVPGGFLEQRETTLQSALRELEEETHLDLPPPTLLACLASTEVFDRPDRSQRGRTITHGHYFDLGDRALPEVRADDDAAAVEWVPIGEFRRARTGSWTTTSRCSITSSGCCRGRSSPAEPSGRTA